ncbi:MAG TPA: hypothetical protein PKE55_10640 [Kiritimatiellia bacterium]|nr:hypothetical protein [Kiritimatiellia bacterium]
MISLPPPSLWQRWLLLESAGELPLWKRPVLSLALALSPSLRAYREQIRDLTAPLPPPSIPPLPDWRREQLLHAAREQLDASPSSLSVARPSRRALPIVAGLALILAISASLLIKPPSPSPHHQTTADLPHPLSDPLSDDNLTELAPALLLTLMIDPDWMSIDDLAYELLYWEGPL